MLDQGAFGDSDYGDIYKRIPVSESKNIGHLWEEATVPGRGQRV